MKMLIPLLLFALATLHCGCANNPPEKENTAPVPDTVPVSATVSATVLFLKTEKSACMKAGIA